MTPDKPAEAREREAFEKWFGSTRHSKGVEYRAIMFDRRPEDGTYVEDHTQRHWWTWQNARASLAAEVAQPQSRAVAPQANEAAPMAVVGGYRAEYDDGAARPESFLKECVVYMREGDAPLFHAWNGVLAVRMKGYVIRPFEQNRALVEAAMQALEALEQVRLSRVYVGITPREEVAAIAALRQALEAKA
jgi:hypothetical protein